MRSVMAVVDREPAYGRREQWEWREWRESGSRPRYDRPGASGECRDVATLHPADGLPWLKALETFGIPFVTYGRDGAREYLSEAAAALLHGDGPGAEIWEQAARLVADALAERAVRPTSTIVRRTPTPLAGCGIAVHLAPDGTAGPAAVAVLQPVVPSSAPPEEPALSGLSRRERQVAELVGAGRSSKEIAALLSISIHTVRHHVERVYEKLGVRGRVAVAVLVAGGTERRDPPPVTPASAAASPA